MIQTDNVIETTIQPELESSDLFQPTLTRQVNDELNILIGDDGVSLTSKYRQLPRYCHPDKNPTELK